MASTPLSSSSAAYLLAVSISSRKSTSVMPAGLTIPGVPSSVMPMKPTRHALDLAMVHAGRIVSPVSS